MYTCVIVTIFELSFKQIVRKFYIATAVLHTCVKVVGEEAKELKKNKLDLVAKFIP